MDVHRKIAVYVLLVGFLSAIVVAPDRHLRIEHAHGDQHLRHLRLSNGPHKQSNFSTQEDAPEDTHSQAQEETRFQFEICPYVLTGPEPINHIQKWLDFVDLLAREVEDADETEVTASPPFPSSLETANSAIRSSLPYLILRQIFRIFRSFLSEGQQHVLQAEVRLVEALGVRMRASSVRTVFKDL